MAMGEFDVLLADLNEVRRKRDMAKAIGAPISATEARQKLDVPVRDGAPAHEVSKTEAMIHAVERRGPMLAKSHGAPTLREIARAGTWDDLAPAPFQQ
jgi:hypothetical protein